MVTNGAILHRLCGPGAAGVVGKSGDIAALGHVCQRVPAGDKGPPLPPTVAARPAEAAPELTAKELEVVRLFAGGSSPSETARQQNRSLTTLANQKPGAMRKLRVGSNADLVARARDRGLA